MKRQSVARMNVRLLVAQGLTSAAIAAVLNVTRQAVHHHAAAAGITETLKANGKTGKPPKPPTVTEQKAEMSMERLRELRAAGATRAFQEQRRNAAHRGIGWRLTLAEWWAIWEESGKWGQRGRTKGGWVMGRFGDAGAYEVGNVCICDHSENAKVAQSHANRPKAMPRVEPRPARSAWVVVVGTKYQSTHKSKDAAIARAQQMRAEMLAQP